MVMSSPFFKSQGMGEIVTMAKHLFCMQQSPVLSLAPKIVPKAQPGMAQNLLLPQKLINREVSGEGMVVRPVNVWTQIMNYFVTAHLIN